MSVCIEERAGAVGFEQRCICREHHQLATEHVSWVCEEGCWEGKSCVQVHVGEGWLCES